MADQLGPYRLLRVLGRGSFGVVYEAEREGFPGPVALKVLQDVDGLEQEDLRRFWLEGQIASRLRGAGLVPVLDMGEVEGVFFLAMELVPGETLKQRLSRGALPLHEAAGLVRALAHTLARVHKEGVLHRDLKPANVILDARTGRPRITDFGLARDRSLARSLTKTGEVLGTPVYMPPEQILGRKDLDRRVDVYALGVIFYECVTGRRPFAAASLYELQEKITQEACVPPSELDPRLPPEVDEVCERALAKDPGDRHVNCDALIADLDRFLAQNEGSLRPVSERRRGPWLLAALGGLLLAGAGGFGLSRLSAPPSTDPGPTPERDEAQTPAPTPVSEPRDLLSAARRVRALGADAAGAVEAEGLASKWAEAARRHSAEGLSADELDALSTLLDRGGAPRDRAQVVELRVRRHLELARGVRSVAAIGAELDPAHRLAEREGLRMWVERVDLVHARLLIERGHYEDAAKRLQSCLPDLRGPALMRARLLFCYALQGLRSGWQAAPRSLELLARDAGRTSIGLVADVLYTLRAGRRLRRRDLRAYERLLRDAEAKAREALRLEPDMIPALIALGSVLSRRGSPEAAEVWRRLERAAPTDSRAAWAKASAYRRRNPALERAARDRYLELSAGARSYVRARYLKARGWERLQAKEPGARGDLEEVIETRPFDMRPHLGLAALELRAGRVESARRHVLLAASLAPETGRDGGDVEEVAQSLPPGEGARLLEILVAPRPSLELQAAPAAHRSALRALLIAARSSASRAVLVRDALAAAAQVTPDHPSAALLRARLAVGRDLYDAADKALAACVATGAPAAAVRLLRADLARRRGQDTEARAHYVALAQGSGREARLARGELHLWAGEFREAGEVAARLLAESSQDAAALILQSQVSLAEDATAALMWAARARAVQGEEDLRAILTQHRAHVALIQEGQRAWLPMAHYQAIPLLSPSAHTHLALVETLLIVLRSQPSRELIGLASQLLEGARQAEPSHPRLNDLESKLKVLAQR